MDPTPSIRQNGHAIRALRQVQGISLTELAESIGAHPQALRNVELENRQASPVLLNRIACALGIDTAAILRSSPRLMPISDMPEACSEALAS